MPECKYCRELTHGTCARCGKKICYDCAKCSLIDHEPICKECKLLEE